MRPANIERLALLVGASPDRAYSLAVQHQQADIRPWLTPLLLVNIRRLRERFEYECTCPYCESHDTRTLCIDRYARRCNVCHRTWCPLEII